MKNIIFIAPPAAGKGTLSEMLIRAFDYKHISTGDILREEINSGSEFGKKIKKIIDNGNLVSDDIMIELIKNILLKIKGPFILDGFPRTINQAKELDEILDSLNIGEYKAIYLDVDKDVVKKRMLGRINCVCGKSYNLYEEAFKPKNDGICDQCGKELIKRDDDNEETFNIRFETFLTNNQPIIDYYKKNNKFNSVNANDNSDAIYNSILEIIND